MSILIGTPYIYNKEFCSSNTSKLVSTVHKKSVLAQLEKVFNSLHIKVKHIDHPKAKKLNNMCSALWIRDIFVKIDDTYVLLPGVHKGEDGLIRENEYMTVASLFPSHIKNDASGSNMEGGDILQDGNTILVGMNKRTNKKGAAFLKSNFKQKKIITITHKSLHLDCCLCILHNNILIYSKKSIGKLPSQVESKYMCLDLETILGEKIDTNLALNFIIINKDIITAYIAKFKPLYDFLELMGYTVHHIKFYNLHELGGGLRCLTQWINTPQNQVFF